MYSTGLWGSVNFPLIFFFCLLFRLGDLYWYVFKFTDSSDISNLLLRPSICIFVSIAFSTLELFFGSFSQFLFINIPCLAFSHFSLVLWTYLVLWTFSSKFDVCLDLFRNSFYQLLLFLIWVTLSYLFACLIIFYWIMDMLNNIMWQLRKSDSCLLFPLFVVAVC